MPVNSYPAVFHLLDDGTWLIMDSAIARWFHTPTLLPFINGFKDDHEVPIADLADLMKRSVAQCHIGFEFKEEERVFEIWAEGFLTPLAKDTAKLMGKARGKDFKEACDNLAFEQLGFAEGFERDTMSWEGLKLFDNETEARENYG